MRIPTSAIVLAVVTAASVPAAAQTSGETLNSFSRAIEQGWNGAKQNLLKSAEQMPEANYSFRPVDTVRTFGQIIAHVAGANYIFCSAAKGEKSPFTEDHFEKTAKTKAEIVKGLTDSVASCDAAYNGLTDSSAMGMAEVFGNKTSRAAALMGNTGHVQEHYGNLVTYMRIKGMVPPSSAPRQ